MKKKYKWGETEEKEMEKVLSNMATNKFIKERQEEEEEENITCCGDEITGEVADIGLCPTCKEHI